MNNPPEKYWQLLELALADFDVIRQDPNYTINMMIYHDGVDYNKCRVCLAGSVMARTLHGAPTDFYTPDNFPEWKQALYDLNSFALGSWPGGLSKEQNELICGFQTPIRINPYAADPAHWRAHMGRLVQWLKERDL